jgi:ubiquinol-cytochrome c reductase cytochrome b subunit
MSDDAGRDETRRGWLMRHTTFGDALGRLFDEPASGAAAWARTLAGVVALLLSIQILTGALLAFYYVPSADSAHATVAYMEKALAGGSFLRSLHYHASQLLPLALVLHLAQMLWSGAFGRKPIGWTANLLLLALVFANGATGYSLPWDARAFFSTQVASNIAGGAPLIGTHARAWVIGGSIISTLTLSRFYALHILCVPALICATIIARLLILKEPERPFNSTLESAAVISKARAQFVRNAIVMGIAALLLFGYAATHPAPLGPTPEAAPPGYLPRPGAQFLWLFQLLKYFPAPIASLLALLVPAFFLGALGVLPFLPRLSLSTRRKIGLLVFALGAVLVTTMTSIAYLQDARNPRVRERLGAQAREEEEFRRAPFAPLRSTPNGARDTAPAEKSGSAQKPNDVGATAPPPAFLLNCARCHGERGEGKSIYPPLVGVAQKPKRDVTDIIAILNNPSSYGLERGMPSFADKLTDAEKRVVAEWVASLK